MVCWWYLGGVSVVSRWCLGGVSVVSRWCLSGVSVVSPGHLGGVSVVSSFDGECFFYFQLPSLEALLVFAVLG